jgi:anti-sigma-K factor RskA
VLDVGAAVTPLHRRRRRPLLAVAAVAATCAAIVLGIQSSGTRPLAIAGLKAYDVRGMDGALLVGRSGEAVLMVHGLPAPAAGTAYELWIVHDGAVTRAGFLRGRVGMVTRPVPPGATVAVSLEPAAGSKRPTGPLLLTAETA